MATTSAPSCELPERRPRTHLPTHALRTSEHGHVLLASGDLYAPTLPTMRRVLDGLRRL